MVGGSLSGLHDSNSPWHLDAVSGSHPPHPLCGHTHAHQCGSGRRDVGKGRRSGRGRASVVGASCRRDEAVGARLYARAAGSADDRGSGRRGRCGPGACGGGVELSETGTGELKASNIVEHLQLRLGLQSGDIEMIYRHRLSLRALVICSCVSFTIFVAGCYLTYAWSAEISRSTAATYSLIGLTGISLFTFPIFAAKLVGRMIRLGWEQIRQSSGQS